MKLRLAVPNQDLAYRFGISTSRVSQLFHEWIDVMAREFGQLIRWPHREIIRKICLIALKLLIQKPHVLLIVLKSLLKELHLFVPKVRHTLTTRVTTLQSF